MQAAHSTCHLMPGSIGMCMPSSLRSSGRHWRAELPGPVRAAAGHARVPQELLWLCTVCAARRCCHGHPRYLLFPTPCCCWLMSICTSQRQQHPVQTCTGCNFNTCPCCLPTCTWLCKQRSTHTAPSAQASTGCSWAARCCGCRGGGTRPGLPPPPPPPWRPAP